MIALTGLVTWIASSASALPIYAARERKPCAFCHINPAGGGPRNEMGLLFAANGHRFPAPGERAETPQPTASHESIWDRMTFSATIIMAHTLTEGQHGGSGDCLSCHDSEFIPDNRLLLMSGRAELAVRVTDDLTVQLSNDLGTMREAYALYAVRPGLVSVKAGLFVVPFGLKMRDHTPFIRGKFNVGSNRRDVGVALQGNPGPFFYEAALTRGGDLLPLSPPVQRFEGDKKTVALVAGIRWAGAQLGGSFLSGRGSFVDRFRTPDEASFRTFENPKGYDQLLYDIFGSYSTDVVTLEGELVYGTDRETRSDPTGNDPRKTFPRLGSYLGLTVTPIRRLDLGMRYEFFEPSRDHEGDALTNYVFFAEADVTSNVSIQGRYRIRQESSASFDNNDFMTILRIGM